MINMATGHSYTYRRLTKVLIGTLVTVFSILIAGGFLIFKNEAPRPTQIVSSTGDTLVTKAELISGQAVYENMGLLIMVRI